MSCAADAEAAEYVQPAVRACYDLAMLAKSVLEEPHVREFDITGRPMRGWVLVELEARATAEQLGAWAGRSLRFVEGLPGT